MTAVAPDLIADAAAYAAVLGNGVRKRRRDRIEFRVGESTAYKWSVEDYKPRPGCVIDGVFEPAVAQDDAPSVRFHTALEFGAEAFAEVQARVRTRVLRTFVKRGLIWMHQ